MNTQQQHAPTRQAVLVAHWSEMRLRTGVSHERWAERLDGAYCALVPDAQRSVPAPDLAQVTGAEDFRKLLRNWDQTIRRYVSGDLRMPVELEEAWVVALDDPWRTNCTRELAQRMGCYGAIRRADGPAGDGEAWAATLQSMAALTAEMSQVLDDGRIDARDANELPDVIRDARRMQADLESLAQRAEREMQRATLRRVS